MKVIVTRKQMEAEAIASFELAAVDGAHLPPFSAGSHVDVRLPGGITRQYSLCNSPDETHRYLIAVLRDPQSRGGSLAMHDAVSEGSELEIGEPRNLFPLAHEAKRTVLLAGGIGITPVLCMAERLAQIGAPFELHYCSRSIEKTAFVQRIRSSSFSQNAHFYFDAGPETERFRAEKVLSGYSSGDHLYVCGPGGFMDFILASAKEHGWDETSLHREYFAAAPTAKEDDGSFEVQVSSTGMVLNVPADRSIVDVLSDAGIAVPVSCEQGICGTCVTRVIEGVPDHRDMFLTDAEHARNDQFTPCCSRACTPRLVLDL
ncbi:PDR/VanB family oxidoreductase [Pseudomonas sp. CC120222-01a]|uniref:PDR/VanB family oxidoreductase n=1 Tax=Pseudomonas sp. CC120222-01a TaxID=1378075 RepID=UPI000D8E958A|nr:PDR/VanB family oxidoreductase [Pseudomonas sp. CC120222-01a]PVZ42522.1 vanillate O-demethylase ferredoxin subunit [Pseudomonas sp. CC120222-01a]